MINSRSHTEISFVYLNGLVICLRHNLTNQCGFVKLLSFRIVICAFNLSYLTQRFE